MDYPKTMYRGAFTSKADLEAAWNSQAGIEQKIVANEQEQEALMKTGFVEQPIDLVKMQVSSTAPPLTVSRKGAKDEPLNVNG